MAKSNHNSSENNDDNRKTNGKRRKIEPARKAPDSERGLTHSPYFNGPLYERMSQDLHLGGMAKRTHEGYLRAVRQLADFCKCSPDQITEDQLRRFFLHLKNDKAFASGSLRVAYSGVKFFYTRTCKRDWQTLAQMRIKDVKSLPEVLTVEQVHQIIDACTTLRMAVYFWTVYSLGLRMNEGLNLQIGDIDGHPRFCFQRTKRTTQRTKRTTHQKRTPRTKREPNVQENHTYHSPKKRTKRTTHQNEALRADA